MLTSPATDLKAYDPNQPRVPKGSPEGGEWAAAHATIYEEDVARLRRLTTTVRTAIQRVSARQALTRFRRVTQVVDGPQHARWLDVNGTWRFGADDHQLDAAHVFQFPSLLESEEHQLTADQQLDVVKELQLRTGAIRVSPGRHSLGVDVVGPMTRAQGAAIERAADGYLGTRFDYDLFVPDKVAGAPEKTGVTYAHFVRDYRHLYGATRKAFNPNQPRVPKGDPRGGEWTDGGGTSVEAIRPRTTMQVRFAPVSAEQAHAWGRQAFFGWWKRLRPAEQEAVYWYMHQNQGGPDLDSALSKGRVPENIVVFRGLRYDEAQALYKKKVGQVVTEPGYLSTSLRHAMAVNFMDGGQGFVKTERKGAILELRVPKGTQAGYITASVPNTPKAIQRHEEDFDEMEHELLLPRGTRWRVVSVAPEHVIGEVVDQRSASTEHIVPRAVRTMNGLVLPDGTERTSTTMSHVGLVKPTTMEALDQAIWDGGVRWEVDETALNIEFNAQQVTGRRAALAVLKERAVRGMEINIDLANNMAQSRSFTSIAEAAVFIRHSHELPQHVIPFTTAGLILPDGKEVTGRSHQRLSQEAGFFNTDDVLNQGGVRWEMNGVGPTGEVGEPGATTELNIEFDSRKPTAVRAALAVLRERHTPGMVVVVDRYTQDDVAEHHLGISGADAARFIREGDPATAEGAVDHALNLNLQGRQTIPATVGKPKVLKAFNPNQPRAPKGTPIGGEWVDADGAAHAQPRGGVAQTPAFQRWFGNSVVRRGGQPRVMYHGTLSEFTTFNVPRDDIGVHVGTREQAQSRVNFLKGEGARGTTRLMPVYVRLENPLRMRDVGQWDAFNVAVELENHARWQKTIRSHGGEAVVATAPGFTQQEIDAALDAGGALDDERPAATDQRLVALRRLIESKGYDGIVYTNTGEPTGQRPQDSYIVFHPEQLKSVTENRGTFDPTDPDITHAVPQAATSVGPLSTTVTHATAAAPLKRAKLKVISVADVPQAAKDQLGGTDEPTLASRHVAAAKGVAATLDHLDQHPWAKVRELAGFVRQHLEVAFMAYEPHQAAMTMVQGEGRAILLINTRYQPEPGGHAFAIAGFEEDKVRQQGGTEEAALAALYTYTTYHELGHILDKATDGALTNMVVDSLILQMPQDRVQSWIAKNISPYAATSPRDTAAEVFTMIAAGRKLPKELAHLKDFLG